MALGGRLGCAAFVALAGFAARVLDRAHPHLVVAGLWRVALLEAPEDDVETGGDGTVPVPGGVLVAVTGGGVGMAETGHQLALGGAGPGGEGAGRVAQVVDVQLVVPHLLAGPAPVLVEGRGREEATALGGKEERVRVVADAVEVPGERVEDELGESDHPPACLGLGLGKEATSAVEAHDLFFDGDRAGVQVDVAAPKQELAEAQASEAGEEDESPEISSHGVHQFETQLGTDDRTLDGSLRPGASHPAGVGLDEAVGHCCREDRPRRAGRTLPHSWRRSRSRPWRAGGGGFGVNAPSWRLANVGPMWTRSRRPYSSRVSAPAADPSPGGRRASSGGIVGEELSTGPGVDSDAFQLVVGDLGGPGVGGLAGGE